MAESGYNNTIWNTSGSGAYGIAQADPASKYPLAGRPPSEGGKSDPKTQEVWELDYVKGRYGDPVKAKAFHLANNSYANGTNSAVPGWAWTGDRGPELQYMGGGEKVVPAGASAHVARQAAKGVTDPSALISPANSGGCKGHDVKVSLDFKPGSIVVQGDLGSSGSVSGAATELIYEINRRLESEQMFAQIAAGAHHGG